MNLKLCALAFAFLALPAMAHSHDDRRWERPRRETWEAREDRGCRQHRLAPPWAREQYRPRRDEREVLIARPEPRLELPLPLPRISLWIGF